MAILSAAAKAQTETYKETRTTGNSGYLRTSDIESGGKVRFTVLSDDTQSLVFYELWAESKTEKRDDGTPVRKCLRFASEPTAAEVEHRLLDEECEAGVNRFGRPETVKLVIALAVWNYDAEAIQVFAPSQPTIIDQLNDLTTDPDVEEDPAKWDFELTRKDLPKKVEYTLALKPGRRSKAAENQRISDAWEAALEAGFDLTALLHGGDPFKPAPF